MELSLLLGVLVGAILGLTGAGGGILAVPALVAGLGWTMQAAAPVALIAVAGSAALGAAEGLRKGLVRYRAALVMVLTGVPLTSLGVTVAHSLSQRCLLATFGLVLLIVATRLILRARSGNGECAREDHALAHMDPASGRLRWSSATAALFACIGAFTGFMTGLLGVGGGFIIVPLLRRFTDITMHGIVATSLMVIALVGSGGIYAAVSHGVSLPVQETALFSVATAMGMLAGRRGAALVSERQIQRGFAVLLVLVAAGMFVKAALLA